MKTLVVAITITAVSIFFISCKDKSNDTGNPKPGAMSGAVKEGHPKIDTKSKIKIEPGSIKKAAAGFTVEECYTKQASLKDKRIKIRGKVVKFNPDIMSRNWLHIQDGTGKPGTNDLTVTTINKAKVGDTVIVEGKLSLNKDFGANYVYKVILEGATVKVEK